MDLRLIQVTLLIVMLSQLSESSVEVNSPQSLLKSPCWLCDVPRCKQCVTSQWTPWSQCSSPCGKKGYQSRSRLVHRPSSCPEGTCQHLPTKEWQPCNRFCHNGGSPAQWLCSCPQNYTGDCCETGLLVFAGLWCSVIHNCFLYKHCVQYIKASAILKAKSLELTIKERKIRQQRFKASLTSLSSLK